jgi:O-succinylhomoserine sulfhydrylase
MFLTSSFVFGSAAEAAARFSGAEAGPIYARFTNPGVTMFEERLAALEGAERCVAFASGMAAILATVMGLMKAGEHVVASRSIFGSTVQLFQNILGRFGVETTFVSPTDPPSGKRRSSPTPAVLRRVAFQPAHGSQRYPRPGRHRPPARCLAGGG